MYIDRDSKFFDSITKIVEKIVDGYSIGGFVLSFLLMWVVSVIAFEGFNREMSIKQILKNKFFNVCLGAVLLTLGSYFVYKNVSIEQPQKSVLETHPFPAEK